MKTTSALMVVKTIVLSTLCIGLLATQAAYASGKPYRTYTSVSGIHTGGDALSSFKKEKSKTIFLSNNSSVKIYLDPPQKKLHVIAKDTKGKQIDFFVFDVEGTLIHNHKMKTNDHHKITNLSKGTYIYRVFCGDEETASGQFEIK